MLKRILSTFSLWAIVLLALRFFGSEGAIWMITLIGILTLREFYTMVARTGVDPFDKFGMILGAAITLGPLYFDQYVSTPELLALAVIVFSVRILGEREPENRIETLAWSLFGVIYVPFMLHYIARITLIESPHTLTGLFMALWLIAVSKFCDTGALLFGMAFGKHKMSPQISPKKTWEGFAGGLFTSALVGAGIAWFARDYFPVGFTPWLAALVAMPIGAIAAVSDLIESIMKRRASMKDSGKTIPGIGGMFDLTDSLILAAPLGYVVFNFLSR
ncbi:MAG TPA: phosphatidate cytidylyltransferase [Opitutaceae bacterium]|nr:phosphatidate cytidylyltransferase [Opitutaceae bacterium]